MSRRRADSELPADAFQRDPAELAAAEKAKKDKAEKDKTDYEQKLKAGKDRAKELTDRFAAWYYVIPGDSFRNVMLDREALVRPKAAQDRDSDTPGGVSARWIRGRTRHASHVAAASLRHAVQQHRAKLLSRLVRASF